MKDENLKNIKHVINGDYIVIPIETGYIKPHDNLDVIINPAKELMELDVPVPDDSVRLYKSRV